MKYLENTELEKLSYFISNSLIGDDKKLSKSLKEKFVEEYGTSSSSSIGDLTQNSTRQLLIDLVQTMNASFVDHDFSTISPEAFRPCQVNEVMHQINSYLSELTTTRPSFINDLWSAINDQIGVHDCDAYSYTPDLNDDPLSDGAIWSFNCFFVSKELKRICYFSCVGGGNGPMGRRMRTMTTMTHTLWTTRKTMRPTERARRWRRRRRKALQSGREARASTCKRHPMGIEKPCEF